MRTPSQELPQYCRDGLKEYYGASDRRTTVEKSQFHMALSTIIPKTGTGLTNYPQETQKQTDDPSLRVNETSIVPHTCFGSRPPSQQDRYAGKATEPCA